MNTDDDAKRTHILQKTKSSRIERILFYHVLEDNFTLSFGLH